MSMVPPRRHGGLFVLLARRVSDRAPLVSRGVRHVRQILNPLRDIRHALHRRDVHAERPSRPEKVRTIIRRQEVMRPRGERQFARRHVRPRCARSIRRGPGYDSPTCAETTSPSTSEPSCPRRWRFRRLLWCCCGIAVRPHGRIGAATPHPTPAGDPVSRIVGRRGPPTGPPRAVYPTWSGCTRSGLFCYSVTSTDADPEQLFVVSDSPVTASTHKP